SAGRAERSLAKAASLVTLTSQLCRRRAWTKGRAAADPLRIELNLAGDEIGRRLCEAVRVERRNRPPRVERVDPVAAEFFGDLAARGGNRRRLSRYASVEETGQGAKIEKSIRGEPTGSEQAMGVTQR